MKQLFGRKVGKNKEEMTHDGFLRKLPAHVALSLFKLARTAALEGVPSTTELTGLRCERLHVDAANPRRPLLVS